MGGIVTVVTLMCCVGCCVVRTGELLELGRVLAELRDPSPGWGGEGEVDGLEAGAGEGALGGELGGV